MSNITIYDNFLDEDDFLIIQEMAEKNFKENFDNDIWTNQYWPDKLRLDSNTVLINYSKKDEEFIKKSVNKKIEKKIFSCMFYYWYPMSHLPWHQDKVHKSGITIYLNDNWDINQGGFFMFSNSKEKNDIVDNNITGIFPKRNRAVDHAAELWHSVSPLSKNSEIRKTIQIFYS